MMLLRNIERVMVSTFWCSTPTIFPFWTELKFFTDNHSFYSSRYFLHVSVVCTLRVAENSCNELISFHPFPSNQLHSLQNTMHYMLRGICWCPFGALFWAVYWRTVSH